MRKMGLEDDYKFGHIQEDLKEVKADYKQISAKITTDNITMTEKMTEMKLSNVRTEESLKKILGTYEMIKAAAIGALVVNIAGILWAVTK